MQCDRLNQHGYPCENYSIATTDNYLLTVFRIPYSHRNHSGSMANKPAVILVHCLFTSSDMWLLSGPDNALPYMLADAGYDVWLANVRGTVYSEHKYLSPETDDFWDFSMDEIALYDMPATIDYIIASTGQSSVHYIGFSQGAIVFMMLMSKQPSYNEKIRTSHLMGPGVFLCRLKSPPTKFAAEVATQNSILKNIPNISAQQIIGIVRKISPGVCKYAESVCIMVMQWITGWGSPHFNTVSQLVEGFL